MGIVLFTLFGKDITWRILSRVLFGLVIGVLALFAYRSVNNHFQHIKDLESSNSQLKKDKQTLTTNLETAEKINKSNADFYRSQLEVVKETSAVAAKEAAASTARTKAYKDIRDDIKKAGPSDQPVGPVTSSVLDSLWR